MKTNEDKKFSGRSDLGEEFISDTRRRLSNEYSPRIFSCLDQLSDDDLWWRAHETDNSIGNLILHLSGNIRQWIVAGIGGASFVRDRQKEFDERKHLPRAELIQLFKNTLAEADEALAHFDACRLLEVRHFQKWEHTCLYAISHVVEHVAQHMGQIIYITKLRKGVDLKFFNL